MKPTLFRMPVLGLPVPAFGCLVAVGFYLGVLLAKWRARRVGLAPNLIHDLAIVILVGGLIGARGFYVVEYWGETIDSFREAVQVWNGGIVFYGGVIGAAVSVLIARALFPFPLLATLDAIAPSIGVGLAVGRIGCFLNGCCYGPPSEAPWAVRFPRDSGPWVAHRAEQWIAFDAPWSLPVHPTQIYAAINGIVLCLLLSAYYPHRRRDGEVVGLMMILYPITRFLLERLRNDENPLMSGMTIAQVCSLFLLAAGLFFWSYLQGRPAFRHADAVAC